ncbi:MAG: hypothetical protein JEY97_05735 [Bacteroidales bacterium]|nr:hypothetical protein [Bacteroidales bacterium]
MNIDPNSSVKQKALKINLDSSIFGTFAEIGAGQEVANHFFKAGASSGTVAKTISAYDMGMSNAFYGEINSKRYVSEERLKKMLLVEYNQLVSSLRNKRPENTCFFAFANTISAINYQKTNESHGWIGIKFQLFPGHEPNEIIMHVKMYEKDNILQKRTLGIIGVNLIYAAFHYYNYINSFLQSLMDFTSRDKFEIDMIKMSGPELSHIDNRLLCLQLVKNKMTNVALFDSKHNVNTPSDIFYKKNIMVIRGSFRPITYVPLDMLNKGFETFKKDNNFGGENTMLFCEISIDNLLKDQEYDEKDFLNRVDLINGLGINVMVSDLKYHYEFVSYFDIYKIYKLGIIISSITLRDLFEKHYYKNLSGGILEGFGKLFKNNVKMYVYPSKQEGTDELLTSENLIIEDESIHILNYLRETHKLSQIKNIDIDKLNIFSKTVVKYIQEGNSEWEKMVPPFVSENIKAKSMFGYNKNQKDL